MSAELDLQAARADLAAMRGRLALLGDERDRAVARAAQLEAELSALRGQLGAAEYRAEAEALDRSAA